jgi:hypothetical protein
VEIYSTVTRKRYLGNYWRTVLFAMIFTIVLGLMVVFLIGLVFKDPMIKILWIGVPVGIAALYLFFYIKIFTSKENKESLFAKRQFIIDEKGIEVTAGEFHRFDSWGNFYFWNEANGWINIMAKTKPARSVIIPDLDMTASQRTELTALLVSKIGAPNKKRIDKQI